MMTKEEKEAWLELMINLPDWQKVIYDTISKMKDPIVVQSRLSGLIIVESNRSC